jgi:N-acetyl-anhydromuramyl-L-alanine amidase AmpD
MNSSLANSHVASPYNSSRDGHPIERIIMHTVEGSEVSTAAEGVANYFKSNSRKVSAHYVVDNNSIVSCVPEERVANHAAGDNYESIGIELAGRAGQTAAQWADAFSRAELVLAAKLVADICKRRNIPVRELTDAQLKARWRGLASHDAVSRVFGDNIRDDPGSNFPWTKFLGDVRALIDNRKWQVRLLDNKGAVVDRSSIVGTKGIAARYVAFSTRVAPQVAKLAAAGRGPRVRVVRV